MANFALVNEHRSRGAQAQISIAHFHKERFQESDSGRIILRGLIPLDDLTCFDRKIAFLQSIITTIMFVLAENKMGFKLCKQSAVWINSQIGRIEVATISMEQSVGLEWFPRQI